MRALCAAASLAAALIVTNAAHAQVVYDPYAPFDEPKPAIALDGTINWPTFFKSAKFEQYYENLWAMGACRGTNPRISVPAMQNRVNINKLPEAKVEGRVVRVRPGSVDILDSQGKLSTVITHPNGVSRVTVKGDTTPLAVLPKMFVRLQYGVDSDGKGLELVKSFDVITPGSDFKYKPVQAEVSRTITGEVIMLKNRQLVVKVNAGTIRRLRYTLTENAVAYVDAKNIGYSGVGDAAEAKGHLYDTTDGRHLVFASDVSVDKNPKPKEKEKVAANPAAAAAE